MREGSANCLQGATNVPQRKKETMKAEHGGKGKDQNSFLTDITEIRRRARQHIEDGAVTDAYKGDRKTVLRVLNEALATEIVCVLRYKRHHYMARGIHSQAVAEEFLEHAAEEQEHADLIAERITQLDGEPNFNPDGLLTRSHSEYVEGESLIDMIREDLIAERIAVESYSEIIRYLADNDPTSRRLMESILAKEEEHAEEMKTLLEAIAREEKQEDRAQAS
jgi:bacterioferritin